MKLAAYATILIATWITSPIDSGYDPTFIVEWKKCFQPYGYIFEETRNEYATLPVSLADVYQVRVKSCINGLCSDWEYSPRYFFDGDEDLERDEANCVWVRLQEDD